MPNGNQSLLSFTDIFSQLGMGDQYLGVLQDPTKYFGLGQEYAKFFPGAEMYQQQLTKLLGTGEGSLAEREATLGGQVQQQYGLGRQQATGQGTQSLLGLGQQFRQQQAKSGFAGSGALQSAYGTGQQEVGREYGQRLGMLGEQRERGMFGVEEDISGLRGQAQSLLGQYVQSLFGIGRDIWSSMPDINNTATADGAAAASILGLAPFGPAFIQRLRIESGGVVIEDIDEYSRLFAMTSLCQCPESYLKNNYKIKEYT